MPKRSVPVTDFDVASAFVAAGISTSTDPDLKWDADGTLDLPATAQWSDALWMRIGEESVSPALVAYIDEYCQAYPAISTAPSGTDPVRKILAAPNLCAGRDPVKTAVPAPVDCLVVGDNDPSAPAALAGTWTVAPGGSSATSKVRKHWFTGMAACKTSDK